MNEPPELSVEATGETVGEAKWAALRELESLHPGIDKRAVAFQVVSEGERGILGVGYAPARVIATAPSAGEPERTDDESVAAGLVRELLERIAAAGVSCRIDIVEDEESLRASLAGGDLGVLIGRHGQSLDAIQQLASAFVFRSGAKKEVTVDAAGYRARRQATLESLARRAAQRVADSGEPVALEPMTPSERRIVHQLLAEDPSVETASEGSEPYRRVVVVPARG